jgi:threonine aldolase
MNKIDLRSDTVTRPTAEMRLAMSEAEVGDDVYGEDPTVNLLERRAAEIVGKEAALFVPTGTMGNTIAIKLHTQHGQEVICDARAHLLDWELSMAAWFCGCLIRPVSAPVGLPLWEHYRTALRPIGPNNAPTACVEIENTHNMLGGLAYRVDDIDEICFEAHVRNLKVHMDGARLFNAGEAIKTPVNRIARDVDTVMFCLSKGLGAPVGSMLAGTAVDIARARGYRKRLGGGMRQAGVLAAAGLIALEDHPRKLEADHANARLFACLIADIPGIVLNPAAVESNIIVFDIAGTGLAPEVISAGLLERGVVLNPINDREMRAVTHYDVSEQDCRNAAAVLRTILS